MGSPLAGEQMYVGFGGGSQKSGRGLLRSGWKVRDRRGVC